MKFFSVFSLDGIFIEYPYRKIILCINKILSLINIIKIHCNGFSTDNYENYTVSSNKMKSLEYRRYREIIFRACYNVKVHVIMKGIRNMRHEQTLTISLKLQNKID